MKKRSKTIIICAVLLLVVAAGLGVWALVHYLKTQSSDDGNEVAAAIVDMNDSTPGDYGKIYYAPIDEKHIAEEGSTRFIDNEVLIVVKDGVSEAQVRELAAKYNSEIVGAIEVSGDYQLRLKEAATKEALEGMLQRIEGEEIVENASLDYVIEASATEDEEQHAGYDDHPARQVQQKSPDADRQLERKIDQRQAGHRKTVKPVFRVFPAVRCRNCVNLEKNRKSPAPVREPEFPGPLDRNQENDHAEYGKNQH